MLERCCTRNSLTFLKYNPFPTRNSNPDHPTSRRSSVVVVVVVLACRTTRPTRTERTTPLFWLRPPLAQGALWRLFWVAWDALRTR
ncbi:hypothetical protein BD410DRAFT_797410 [Rickenella mellea]|uniref:Uncharacterized protein n=1 Tax=Rickenella mellea TaxID=50990 RepID=A0A4Y7PG05_9AGAM|nr:hypothetical protein BD410DRAFT_797410 [Rickenella mellea]